MNRFFYRAAALAAFGIATFATTCGATRADSELVASSQTSSGGEVVTEKPGRVEFEKTLADGAKATVVKIGDEPAVATIVAPGKEPTRVEAFDPLETAPEEAREYLREVWDRLGETPKKQIDVAIDVDAAPDAVDWARRARARVQYWYPKIVEMLDGRDGLDRIPADFQIRLVFKPFDGVAYASGREITVSSDYIKSRPDDFGLVIHETTHVAQAYPRVREVWAMEGMTDWIRYFVTEPRSRNLWRVDPERSGYADGYGVTASFFNWIVKTKDPEFIRKIHKAFRWGGSVELLAREEYRKSLAELWDEYVDELKEKRE